MYDYNLPERLNQKRLTMLLLSLVIPTDPAVLKKIYKKKRELEDNDDACRYPRGPYGWWNGGERYCPDDEWEGWCNLWSREFSKSLTLIGCLYPNFIMYAKNEDWIDQGSYYSQLRDIYPLKKNNAMRDNGISVLNYIVDNWDSICNSDGNYMTGWRIKPSLEELTHFMDDQYTPFDILNERLNDFKYQIHVIMSTEQLANLVEDSGILVDEYEFINF